jgi:hypothetical protein
MAPNMNVNVRSFRDKYKDTVDNLKRNVLQYVKQLQEAAGEREIEEVEQDEAAQIKMTAGGLPILPDQSAWRSRCKKDLEPLIRMYLKQHYSTYITELFSGNSLQAPQRQHRPAGGNMYLSAH